MSKISDSVYLLPSNILTSKESKLLKLRNPYTQTASVYLGDFEKKLLYEVQIFDEKHRCWLIDEKLYSDGNIKIVTTCNPIYLILPYLMKAKKKVPLSDVLEDKKFPAIIHLSDFVEDLTCVADRKGPSDLNVWCYNEKSTLSWLQDKVEKLASKLLEKRERTSEGFSIALNLSEDSKVSYLNLAFGVISEYLTEDLSTLLKKHLKLPDNVKKDKENIQMDQPSKKAKILEETTNKKSPKESKPKQVVSAKAKALAKSAKGTQSISSFFTKK